MDKAIVESIRSVAESPTVLGVTAEEVTKLLDDGEHELCSLESKVASDLDALILFREHLVRFATPADVDVLVTDAEAAPADLARLEDAGIEVVVA